MIDLRITKAALCALASLLALLSCSKTEPPPAESKLSQVLSAANGGDPQKQYEAGLDLFYGKDGPKDARSALEWIGKAADAKNLDAMLFMERTYHLGKGGWNADETVFAVDYDGVTLKINDAKLQAMMKEIASRTQIDLFAATGHQDRTPYITLCRKESDIDESFANVAKAANAQFPLAQVWLASCYFAIGEEFSRNARRHNRDNESRKKRQLESEKMDAEVESLNAKATDYFDKSRELLVAALKERNGKPMFYERYNNLPYRKPASPAEAEQPWIKNSTPYDVELAKGKLLLAEIYEREQVPYWDRAVALLKPLADQGNPDALIRMARFYVKGSGVPIAPASAVRLLTKTADQRDDSDAEDLLGKLYFLGLGVEKDLVQSYAWLNVCAKHLPSSELETSDYDVTSFERIEPESCSGLRSYVGKKLKPDELAKAQAMSAEWKPGMPMGGQSGNDNKKRNSEGHTGKVSLTGTAFFINGAGNLLTNYHVTSDCGTLRIAGSPDALEVVTDDKVNDLALLKAKQGSGSMATFREGQVKQGEVVYVFGYPLSGYLSSTGNLTNGLLSALTGPANNTSVVQITAPVQPGNSGGPLLDERGHVVGVIVAKLNAIKAARVTGDIAQNINFAISGNTVKAFLDANKIEYSRPSFLTFKKNSEDIAADTKAFTVPIECVK